MDDTSNDEPREPLPAAHLTTEKLVTVARFPTVANANLAVALLEEAGIPARVDGATIVQNFSAITIAVGGVRVCTVSTHADEARDLLREAFTQSVGESDKLCPQCGQAMPTDWEICWNCADPTIDVETESQAASATARVSKFPWAAVATLALLAIFVQFGVFAFVGALIMSILVFVRWQRTAERSDTIGELSIEPTNIVSQDTDRHLEHGLVESNNLDDHELVDDEKSVEAIRLRAFRAAIFGWMFPPLWGYALWLLIRLARMPEALEPPLSWREMIAWLLILFGPVLMLVYLLTEGLWVKSTIQY